MRKDIAKQYIDIAAAEARGRYITGGTGQDAVYILKTMQAREFKSRNYEGEIPVLIQSEMDATGYLAHQVTEAILASETLWIQVAAAVERIRRGGKINIDKLDDPELIQLECENCVELLKNI